MGWFYNIGHVTKDTLSRHEDDIAPFFIFSGKKKKKKEK